MTSVFRRSNNVHPFFNDSKQEVWPHERPKFRPGINNLTERFFLDSIDGNLHGQQRDYQVHTVRIPRLSSTNQFFLHEITA